MFGGNTKMCVASRKRSCLHKNDQIEGVRRGGGFKRCQDFNSVPLSSKTPSDQRNVWRVLKTCPERLDGYHGKEPPCQGSGPDQLQWRPPLGRASAGTISHFELKPLLQEKRNVNAFFERYQEYSRSHLEIHCLSVASTLKKASSTCRSKISFEYLISQFLKVLFFSLIDLQGSR